MGLPTTFIGFSSTDMHYYRLMLAWKENEKIDFDFRDCQLQDDIDSEDEDYIKSKCRKRIVMASIFIQLIGEDTKNKYKYVRWEAEVAIEKGCTIIGVNLDKSREMVDATCPPILKNIGAVFVPYSPKIIQHAITNYKMNEKGNWLYPDAAYKELGY